MLPQIPLHAAAAGLLEGLMASPPPRGRFHASVLARSLAEYAIFFSWVAAGGDREGAEDRLRRLVKTDFLERERAANKVAMIRRTPRYEHLFRTGRPGLLPEELLTGETRSTSRLSRRTRPLRHHLTASRWRSPRTST